MRGHKGASRLHRWLAAIIGIQILIWFGSGTIMALLPIEKVRGEHLLKKPDPELLDSASMAADVARAWAALPRAPEKVDIYMLAGRSVLRADFGDRASPILMDVASAKRISPLSRDMAVSLVVARSSKALPHATALWVTEKSTEYRGTLPVWRIDAHDDEAARFYVDPTSGQIKPVRTGLWRIYDFIWGLHIMDWKDHENFNTPWLIGSGLIAFGVAGAGVWLFLLRVVSPWLRRRRKSAAS